MVEKKVYLLVLISIVISFVYPILALKPSGFCPAIAVRKWISVAPASLFVQHDDSYNRWYCSNF
jgi:hypothetical protein